MTITLSLLAGLALFWVLAYVGARLWIWTAAFLAFFVGLNLVGALGSFGLTVALAILLPVAALFNITPLRRSLVEQLGAAYVAEDVRDRRGEHRQRVPLRAQPQRCHRRQRTGEQSRGAAAAAVGGCG